MARAADLKFISESALSLGERIMKGFNRVDGLSK